MQLPVSVKRMLFYWSSSFTIAAIGYYVFLWLWPFGNVFGNIPELWVFPDRYASMHPLQYITIPCFFYGIIATIFSNIWGEKKWLFRALLTFVIVVLVVLISSPFGGILRNYHGMQLGYFPENWPEVIYKYGVKQGAKVGWLVVVSSVPYNLFGIIICHIITGKGVELFKS